MARWLDPRCETHSDVHACPDAPVVFDARSREYGLIVRDGATASVEVAYCPWCGRRLPGARRDQWFDEPEARGIDPAEDEIPAEFRDGTSALRRAGLTRSPHPAGCPAVRPSQLAEAVTWTTRRARRAGRFGFMGSTVPGGSAGVVPRRE